MANTGGKIAVLVVDGKYSALRELGFPFPAIAAMQEQACWDVKLSSSGSYVCELFLASFKSESAEQ